MTKAIIFLVVVGAYALIAGSNDVEVIDHAIRGLITGTAWVAIALLVGGIKQVVHNLKN